MVADRNHQGRFTPEHTDADVLAAVRAHEPAATSEVADELGIARQSADYRLRKLRDAGRVNSKKIGASLVWFSADAERETETEHEDTPDRSDPSPEPTRETDHTPVQDVEELTEAIEAVDTPGSGQTAREREQALRAAYQYLKERGEAQRSDFEELLGDDVGYKGGFDSWWTNYVKAKDALAQLPGVEPPGAEGAHTWRYVGDDVDALETPGPYDPAEEF